MMTNTLVRVASSNNFNCTPKEWAQLKKFAQNHPDKEFFINSNILTPRLLDARKHPYKLVITANPGLTMPTGLHSHLMNRLLSLKDKISFIRVKYLPETPAITGLIRVLLGLGFPIVLTLQRFNSKRTLDQYTSREHYKFSCSRFRLAGKALRHVTRMVSDCRREGYPLYICDQAGKGCLVCKLCSTLTTGRRDLKITSLNLSSSGLCRFNCPDCYSKTMQHFSVAMGHKPMTFDTIHQNDKQAGRLAHQKIKSHV